MRGFTFPSGKKHGIIVSLRYSSHTTQPSRSRSKYAYQYFMLSFSLPVSVFLKKTSFVLPVAVIHPSLYIFSLIQIALSSASVFQLIRSKSKVVNPFWNSWEGVNTLLCSVPSLSFALGLHFWIWMWHPEEMKIVEVERCCVSSIQTLLFDSSLCTASASHFSIEILLMHMFTSLDTCLTLSSFY